MKTLLNVSVPAIEQRYDILVPNFMRIKNLTVLIADAVENLSDHLYVSSKKECLCSLEKGILLKPNSTLEMYGIKNGDHLIMM